VRTRSSVRYLVNVGRRRLVIDDCVAVLVSISSLASNAKAREPTSNIKNNNEDKIYMSTSSRFASSSDSAERTRKKTNDQNDRTIRSHSTAQQFERSLARYHHRWPPSPTRRRRSISTPPIRAHSSSSLLSMLMLMSSHRPACGCDKRSNNCQIRRIKRIHTKTKTKQKRRTKNKRTSDSNPGRTSIVASCSSTRAAAPVAPCGLDLRPPFSHSAIAIAPDFVSISNPGRCLMCLCCRFVVLAKIDIRNLQATTYFSLFAVAAALLSVDGSVQNIRKSTKLPDRHEPSSSS
jgi:hypothetical protein